MSIFRQCFTVDTVEPAQERRWYKQSKDKTSLQGSLYTVKKDISKTRNLDSNAIHAEESYEHGGKLSHFYNDRYPDKYLPGEYRSDEAELQKLKQENISLKQIMRHEFQPLRLRYTQLLQENEIKSNIITGFESRLGFGKSQSGPVGWNRQGISHGIARALIQRQ